MLNKYLKEVKTKSIFGHEIIDAKTSLIFAYIFLLSEEIIKPYFGTLEYEIFAAYLYILISNISILILIINSFLKRKKLPIIYFWLFISPLFVYFTFGLGKIIYSSLMILNLILY